jgi:hypothetical protein
VSELDEERPKKKLKPFNRFPAPGHVWEKVFKPGMMVKTAATMVCPLTDAKISRGVFLVVEEVEVKNNATWINCKGPGGRLWSFRPKDLEFPTGKEPKGRYRIMLQDKMEDSHEQQQNDSFR